MPIVLRKRNPNKHRRAVQLTVTERACALASDFGFTAPELDKPMHKSRIGQLREALGLVSRAVPSLVRSQPALVLDRTAPPAPPPPVQSGDGCFRPWPGELSDVELEALYQQSVGTS